MWMYYIQSNRDKTPNFLKASGVRDVMKYG